MRVFTVTLRQEEYDTLVRLVEYPNDVQLEEDLKIDPRDYDLTRQAVAGASWEDKDQ